jgi:indoleamine 2,3-dioxygenase
MKISNHLDITPCATYAAFCLWNFVIRPPASGQSVTTDTSHKPMSADALDTTASFTGTPDETWFFSISNAIEAHGGQLIPKILSALAAVQDDDAFRLEQVLAEFSLCLDEICVILQRTHENCDPAVFYTQIRPLLSGSRNMASEGLPNGVFYAHGPNEQGEWHQYSGGSNGQSSLIQLFDIFLGVRHHGSGTDNCGAEADNKRGYLQVCTMRYQGQSSTWTNG